NHSAHVNKGIGCVSCHGRVDEMPFTWQVNTLLMEWCLDCHRAPERYVRPQEQVFSMTWHPSDEKLHPDIPSALETHDQNTLGPQLVKEYGLRSLTSCSICHR